MLGHFTTDWKGKRKQIHRTVVEMQEIITIFVKRRPIPVSEAICNQGYFNFPWMGRSAITFVGAGGGGEWGNVHFVQQATTSS